MTPNEKAKARFILILALVYVTCVYQTGVHCPENGYAMLLAIVGWAILAAMWINERSPLRKIERSKRELIMSKGSSHV